jgi:tRNA threonylcarbamoyladenosine biosynthesis protein TsaB
MLKVYRMRVLALDSTGRAGSVALVEDGRVVREMEGDGSRTHGERLPGELAALGAPFSSVDLFAVASGPGSFTGLRIGIATIQGLALAQGKLVTPVTTFDALAFDFRLTKQFRLNKEFRLKAESTGELMAPWIDAHRGEVFATLYDAGGAVLQPPSSRSPEATLDAWSPSIGGHRVAFAGDGAVKYRDRIEARLGSAAGIPADVPALAGTIGLIAAGEPGRAVRPHAVAPLYVRRSDAELARDRRQAADKA